MKEQIKEQNKKDINLIHNTISLLNEIQSTDSHVLQALNKCCPILYDIIETLEKEGGQ